MTYGNIYVAQVAMGANDRQTVRALIEAESYDGPSLVIAYSHCIAQGINMRTGFDQHQGAVDSGAWVLYRYDPRRAEEGLNPLQLDSKAPKIPLRDYAYNETRFKMLTQSKPSEAERLIQLAQQDVNDRWRMYEQLASWDYGKAES
jgi:pyruvate-ferredoxin/flavodoxin oxidoreductase